jgi:hypothetical protein
MAKAVLARPALVEVNRSEFRQRQSALLRKVKGRTMLVISAHEREDEKLVVDREYFDDLVANLRSAVETLAIATDERLFSRILAAAVTLEQDVRGGKLHSFEEAFGER